MLTLYARPDDYKTRKALICARHNGLEIKTVENKDGKHAASPFGRVPVLETKDGCVFSTNAIVRFLSRTRRDLGLYGRNFIESGQVDSWMEFSTSTLEVPLCTITYPLLGLFDAVPQATAQAKIDIKESMQILEKHLLTNTYIVGHQITAADISIVCALADAFTLVFDGEWRSGFPNVMRWFDLIVNQPAVKHVLKDIKLLGEPAKPKQEPKAKAKQEPKAKGKAEPKGKAQPKGKAKAEPKPEKTPEELKKEKLKKTLKEGGKRGVEIEGASDMGGLEFFCTSVIEPDGDSELLELSLKAMCEESKPDDEERKGGAGKVGKMVFSSGPDQLAVICDVPAAKRNKISAKDWMEEVMKQLKGKVVKGDAGLALGVVVKDEAKGIFPIKVKDEGINIAIAHLKSKGLFPDKEDESDEEFVFGDDDFPA